MEKRDKCQKAKTQLTFGLWKTLDKAQTTDRFIHNAVHNLTSCPKRALKRYKRANSYVFSIRAFGKNSCPDG